MTLWNNVIANKITYNSFDGPFQIISIKSCFHFPPLGLERNIIPIGHDMLITGGYLTNSYVVFQNIHELIFVFWS